MGDSGVDQIWANDRSYVARLSNGSFVAWGHKFYGTDISVVQFFLETGWERPAPTPDPTPSPTPEPTETPYPLTPISTDTESPETLSSAHELKVLVAHALLGTYIFKLFFLFNL